MQIVIEFDKPEKNDYVDYFISDVKEAIHLSKWKPKNCKITEEVI